jgi:NAD(P)-dependent dehydrogenase (short-subunit alcohol dehydrogenase family)
MHTDGSSAGPAPVAVVTGGGSGIGLATTMRLLGGGWCVVVGEINKQAVARATSLARADGHGERIALLDADVTDEAAVQALVRAAVERFGHLDAIVNNAGVPGAFGPITEIDVDDWDYTIAVLLRSVFLGTKHAARVFRAAGRGGSILNVASVAGCSGGVGPQAYSAAKAAVINLTKTTAVELAPHRIRVNAVAPGPVLTPLLGEAPQRQSRARDILTAAQPWPDAGLPEDVAAGIAFLLSADARFITGETLLIDGGQTPAGPLPWMRRLSDPIERGLAGVSRGTSGVASTMRTLSSVTHGPTTAGSDR